MRETGFRGLGTRRSLVLAVVAVAVLATPPVGIRARATTSTATTRPLMVADVAPLSADERLVFAALQGIVNRDSPSPRIYLEGMDDTAATWLHDAVPLPTQPTAPYDLLGQFRRDVRGLVVWDPSLAEDTQNVATTAAGQLDLLPVSPTLAATLQAPPYKFSVRLDLRSFHFATRAQAYEWALEHLGPAQRFGALAWHGGSRHGIRDLLVARRAFVFQASPELDAALVARILGAFPPGTPVYGYVCLDDPVYSKTTVPLCEPDGVGEISAAGDFLIPTDLAANLTVHSAFPPVQQQPPWDGSPATLDSTKTYLAFLVSDGDNVGYNEEYLRSHQWVDPARGSIPLGFSISPWLTTYAPHLYDYYVHSLKPDEVLVGGPSGAGYMYPSLSPDLDRYLTQTRSLLSLAGLRTTWILDNGYAYSPSPVTVARYVRALHPLALFTDYFGWVVPNPPPVSFVDGVPVVHAVWGGSPVPPGYSVVDATVGKIRLAAMSYPGHPAFVLVALNTWEMGATQAKQVMARLDPSFVAVRPDRFVALLRAAQVLPTVSPRT